MSKKKEEASFEELLGETEALVETLESGSLGLDDSLKTYEKGIANLRTCAKLITEAEAKVKVLIEETENAFKLEDLDEEE